MYSGTTGYQTHYNHWVSDNEDFCPILAYNQTLEEVYIDMNGRGRQYGSEYINDTIDVETTPPDSLNLEDPQLIPRNLILNLEHMAFSTSTPSAGFKGGLPTGTEAVDNDLKIDYRHQISNCVTDSDGNAYALVSQIEDEEGQNFELSDSGSVQLVKWDSFERRSSGSFEIQTKYIDFGSPNVRKNLYKIYLSSSGLSSYVKCYYRINNVVRSKDQYGYQSSSGSWQTMYKADGSSWQGNNETGDTTDTLYFNSDKKSLRNIYSVQIKILNSSTNSAGQVNSEMKINDLNIVFKTKPVK